jgi:hypothetical protein
MSYIPDDEAIELREFNENAKRLERLHLMEECKATRRFILD